MPPRQRTGDRATPCGDATPPRTTLLQDHESGTCRSPRCPLFVTTGEVPEQRGQEAGLRRGPSVLAARSTSRRRPTSARSTIGHATGRDAEGGPRPRTPSPTELIDFLRDTRQQTSAKAQIAALPASSSTSNRRGASSVAGRRAAARRQRRRAQARYDSDPAGAQPDLQVASATAGFGLQVLQPASRGARSAGQPGGSTSPAAASGSPAASTRSCSVLGLVLGLGAGAGPRAVRHPAADARGGEDVTRLPVLAESPAAPAGTARHEDVVVGDRAGTARSREAYRTLRSSLLLLPSRPVPDRPTSADLEQLRTAGATGRPARRSSS